MSRETISDPDFMPVEELRAMQLSKLQKLVAYEYERVPLFRRRCDEKNVKPRDIVTLKDIAKLPFMVKTDLRDEYPLGLTAAPMKEIVRFHCSSGTTGKPICIPNTKGDIEVWSEAAARCLAMYGITDEDVLQVTYGYGLFTGGLGLHYGGEKRGCAVLPIGGGNTEKQLMLMRDLGVTAIACTPSYFLRIMDVARQQGLDFRRDTRLKHGIFGAEPWTDEMRAKIQEETGITAHDIYGLTEVSGPGVAGSCGHSNGLHIWEDHYYPEIIDPETLEPLPDGEEGELVFTTLDRFGTPMLRYRTRSDAALSRTVRLRTHRPRHGPHQGQKRRHAHHPRRQPLPEPGGDRVAVGSGGGAPLPDRNNANRNARRSRGQGGDQSRSVLRQYPRRRRPAQTRIQRGQKHHRPQRKDNDRRTGLAAAQRRQDQARDRQP